MENSKKIVKTKKLGFDLIIGEYYKIRYSGNHASYDGYDSGEKMQRASFGKAESFFHSEPNIKILKFSKVTKMGSYIFKDFNGKGVFIYERKEAIVGRYGLLEMKISKELGL